MTASMICLINALVIFGCVGAAIVLWGAIVTKIDNVIDNYKNKKNIKIKG